MHHCDITFHLELYALPTAQTLTLKSDLVPCGSPTAIVYREAKRINELSFSCIMERWMKMDVPFQPAHASQTAVI